MRRQKYQLMLVLGNISIFWEIINITIFYLIIDCIGEIFNIEIWYFNINHIYCLNVCYTWSILPGYEI